MDTSLLAIEFYQSFCRNLGTWNKHNLQFTEERKRRLWNRREISWHTTN